MSRSVHLPFSHSQFLAADSSRSGSPSTPTSLPSPAPLSLRRGSSASLADTSEHMRAGNAENGFARSHAGSCTMRAGATGGEDEGDVSEEGTGATSPVISGSAGPLVVVDLERVCAYEVVEIGVRDGSSWQVSTLGRRPVSSHSPPFSSTLTISHLTCSFARPHCLLRSRHACVSPCRPDASPLAWAQQREGFERRPLPRPLTFARFDVSQPHILGAHSSQTWLLERKGN